MSVSIFVILTRYVTLVPNKEEFPRKCGHEDRAVKKAWERWDPTY
jgi:hypothetical protein